MLKNAFALRHLRHTVQRGFPLQLFQKAFRNDLRFDIRFPIDSNNLNSVKEAILANDGKLIKEEKYTDEYYDSQNYQLTLGDIWLRKREGKWQCKAPFIEENKSSHVGKTPREYVPAYKYLNGEKEIRRELNIQQDATAKDQKTLDEDLSNKGIVPFAKFSAEKQEYTMEKYGCQVVIESADFGYHVGEIGVKVINALPQDCIDVPKKITEVAEKLNVKLDQPNVRGIIEEYIHKNDPQHYKALVEASIIHEKTA